MTKIPNNLTPKSMPFSLTKFLLRKTSMKVSDNRNVCLYLISLLYIRSSRNHIKYNFLRKKNQLKIWSKHSFAYLSIKIKASKGSYVCWVRFVERLPCDICSKFVYMVLSMTCEIEFFATIHSNLVPDTMRV